MKYPNATPSGMLADSRVGTQIFRQLRNTRNIQIVTFPSSRENVTPCPAEKAAEVSSQLARLLREDRLYTAEPTDLIGNGDVEIRLPDLSLNTAITLFVNRHRIRFTCFRQGLDRSMELHLDPIGKPLLQLIHEIAPQDAIVRRLSFTPLPLPRPVPLPNVVPSDVLHQVRMVRPGMRRTDILRILREEGGLRTRLQQQFVHPKTLNKQGLSVKVEVQFAPATTPICWIDGVGYPVDIHMVPQNEDQRSDIAIIVSPPFLEYPINR